MQGIWKTKASGWKKDCRRKKQRKKDFISDKNYFLRKELSSHRPGRKAGAEKRNIISYDSDNYVHLLKKSEIYNLKKPKAYINLYAVNYYGTNININHGLAYKVYFDENTFRYFNYETNTELDGCVISKTKIDIIKNPFFEEQKKEYSSIIEKDTSRMHSNEPTIIYGKRIHHLRAKSWKDAGFRKFNKRRTSKTARSHIRDLINQEKFEEAILIDFTKKFKSCISNYIAY